MLKELYSESLLIGLKPEEFWGYDLEEIQSIFEAYKQRQEQEQKLTISGYYQLATLVASMVGASLSGKKPPSLSELYPSLFPVDEQAELKKKQQQLVAWATLINARNS